MRWMSNRLSSVFPALFHRLFHNGTNSSVRERYEPVKPVVRTGESGALIYDHVGAVLVTDVDLARARDFLFGIEQHLFPLSDPSAGTRNGEEHGEHGDGEAHGLIDQAGIEIDIGIELAADEVFVLQGDSLDLESEIEQGISTHYIKDLVGAALDDASAGIVILVDALAKALQELLAGLDALVL